MTEDDNYTVGSVTFGSDEGVLPGKYAGLAETTVAWQADDEKAQLVCHNCQSVWRVCGDRPGEWAIDACWQCCYAFEFSGLADHEVTKVELVEREVSSE